MKCRSPFVWILQCLKSVWRSIFGRKRSGSESNGGLASTSVENPLCAGVTVDSIPASNFSGPQNGNENDWTNWSSDGQSQRDVSKSAYTATTSAKTSAAENWRQSLLQQKSMPPEPVEEPNFFDSMAPVVHKPKVIRLRQEADDSASYSSRLAFNAEVPRVNQFDWMEDEVPAGNWETGLDDLDPREIRKAQRSAQSASSSLPSHNSRLK